MSMRQLPQQHQGSGTEVLCGCIRVFWHALCVVLERESWAVYHNCDPMSSPKPRWDQLASRPFTQGPPKILLCLPPPLFNFCFVLRRRGSPRSGRRLEPVLQARRGDASSLRGWPRPGGPAQGAGAGLRFRRCCESARRGSHIGLL